MTIQEELGEIEAQIGLITRGLETTLDDDPDMPLLLATLGSLYEDRFDLIHELEDINKSIENGSIALSMTPDNDTELLTRLELLGRSHTKRFQRAGDLGDCEKAIEYQSLVLALTPEGHAYLPMRLANLGVAHSGRYKRLGDLDDLQKAIEYKTRAVVLTPNGNADLPMHLANLGASHNDRYQRLGQLDDLEKAIEYASHVVALTPDGHPALPMRLANLGASYGDRYQRLGELDDLEKSIHYNTRAVALTPQGNPSLPMRVANLGVSHTIRYELLGDLSDLGKSIEYKSRAVALTPDDHPDLPMHLVALGISRAYRYKRLGELDDLEISITHKTQAIALVPDGHPLLPSYLLNLGALYSNRYWRLGELDDLEHAIECASRSVTLTPEGHPDLPKCLTNLGASHGSRYHRLGELKDLDKSITYNTRSVALAPDNHPDLPNNLTNLGESLSDRYAQLGELDYLDKAIECVNRALLLTPNGHIQLPTRLSNIAMYHLNRCSQLGSLNDLEKATEHVSRALALLPDGHQEVPVLHFIYAVIFLVHYRRSSDPSDLQVSLDFFRSASQTRNGSPRHKFDHARKWAKYSFKHTSLNPIEAYQTTIELLPQFVWLGATTAQRYQDLATIETLAIDAACAAIRSSDYALALEWLEQARCVVWNQTLMLRSPVDQLQADNPALAARLQAVAGQLHSAGSQPREPQALASISMTIEQLAQEHRRLATEYDDLIAQARELPGFENFLRPMKANSLARAARNGSVVVINCHRDCCDALLIIPGQESVQHVPLPNFTGKDAQSARLAIEKSIRSKGLRERGVKSKSKLGPELASVFGSVLATLWHKIIKPILNHLGYTEDSISVPLPHITWCPTGALSFLPLHAAGDYDQPHSRVFDFVISSYTPTVAALLASTRSALSPDSKVLAVGLHFTPKHSPLPGTALELEHVKDHVQKIAEYTQLVNDRATTASVLDEMEKHNWVHLSCHAHQNVRSPTKSGFFLHDGTLDLASINQRSFKNKGLAYLSACQTATGDERLPDEAVHLGSGMLMAGYSSVIATMWSVVDDDAPLVAEKVYGELMKTRSLGNGEAGRALHTAVAALRDEVGEKAFERWVPYIHIGS